MSAFIGDLLIRLGVEAGGVRQGLDSAAREFQQFEQKAAQALRGANLLPDMGTQGDRAAQQLLRGFLDTYQQRRADLAEQVALGLVSPERAARQGDRAARSLVRSLQAGMAELAERGLLSAAAQQRFVAEIERVGIRGGRANAEQVARGIDAVRPRISATLERALADGAVAGRRAAAQHIAGIADDAARRLRTTGAALSVAVTAPLAAAGGFAIRAGAQMDSLRRSLDAVAGNSVEARRQLAELQEVARAPGLGFAEAIQGSVRLQVVGINAGLAARALREFGNAIAVSGGGRNELERVTVQLQQMAAAGRVLSADLRPITQAAPAAARALQQAFGTIDPQQIESLGLSFEDFTTRWLDAMARLPRATGGLGNSIENMADAAFRARAALGGAMAPAVSQLSDVVETYLGRIENADSSTLRWAVSLGSVAAVAGPAVGAMGLLAVGASSLATALGVGLAPLLLTGGPVVVGLTAAAALFVKNQLEAAAAAGAVRELGASFRGLSVDTLAGKLADAQANLSRIRQSMQGISAQPQPVTARVTQSLSQMLGFSTERDELAGRFQAATQEVNALTGALVEARRAGRTAEEALSTVGGAISQTMQREIELLSEGRRLGTLNAQERQRAAEIERTLNTTLAQGNRTLAERNAIRTALAGLRGEKVGTVDRSAIDALRTTAAAAARSYEQLRARGADVGTVLTRIVALQGLAERSAAAQADQYGETAAAFRSLADDLARIATPSLAVDTEALLRQVEDVSTALRTLGISIPPVTIGVDTTPAFRELTSLRVALTQLQREGVLVQPQMADVGPAVETLRQALRDAELGIPVDTGTIRTAIADIQSHLSRADLSAEVRARLEDIRPRLAESQRVLDGAPLTLRIQLPPSGPAIPPDVMRGLEQQLQGTVRMRVTPQIDPTDLDRLAAAGLRVGVVLTDSGRSVADTMVEGARRAAAELRTGGFFGNDPRPGRNTAPPVVPPRTGPTPEQEQAIRAFNEQVQAVNEVISAFSDLADAAGFLSDELSQGLRGLETLLGGIGRIGAAEGLKGLGKTAAQVSGTLSVAAGVFSVLSAGANALVNAQKRRNQAEAEATLVAIRFRQSLEAARLQLRGFEPNTAANLQAAQRVSGAVVAGFDTGGMALGFGTILTMMDRFGISMAEMTAIAEQYNIKLFDAAGNIDPEAWRRLQAVLPDAISAIERFTQSFKDQLELAAARRAIFDVEDPFAEARDWAAQIRKSAPKLADLLGLDDLDWSDPAAVEAMQRRAFELVKSGIPAEILGQLPGGVRAVLEFALKMDTATDAARERAKADEAAADAARDVASSLSNIPEGFRLFNAALARYEAQAGITQQPPLPPPPPRILPPEATQPRIPRERVEVEAVRTAADFMQAVRDALPDFQDTTEVAQGLDRLRAESERMTDATARAGTGFSEVRQEAARLTVGLQTTEQALATFRAAVEGAPGRPDQAVAGLDAVALQSLRTTAALASFQVGLESAARATERAQSAAPIAAPARAQVVVREAATTERTVVHETVTHDNRRMTVQVYQLPGEDMDTFVRKVVAAIEISNFTQTGDTQSPLPTRG